jgi:DNA-binding LacI/PurR family transcriptional regulator
MASIKEVALKAGVGIATVSRVVNKSGYVKEETKKKIEAVIKELNFKPSAIARSMTLQKNQIVAFILPNTKHLFFGELLYEVEKALFKRNYKLMLCTSSEDIDKEIAYLDMLKTNRVDSVILLTNNDIEPYLFKGDKVISFDRIFEGFPYVASDNYLGGELAAKHLMDRGAKHFMFIGDDQQGLHTHVKTEVSKRRIAFIETLKKEGYQDIVEIEYPLGNYIDIPSNVFKEVLKYPNVDGIFCISDAVAVSIIKALERAGKKVPEDVKVIGYDGGNSFLNLGKTLTSINQKPELTAEMIASIVEAYDLNQEIALKNITRVELIFGETT